MTRRLVLALLLAAAVVADLPAAASGDSTIGTQNVRNTLPPLRARHDLRQTADGASILLAQEMQRRRASWYAPAGWGATHYRGRGIRLNRGDCATYWDRSRWTLVRSYPYQLTYADYPGGHGRRWALVTILRGHGETIAAVCVHMLTRALDRPLVYRHGVARLHALTARLAQSFRVVVGGDWNLGHPWDERTRLVGFPAAAFHAWSSRATVRRTTARARLDYFYWSGFTFRHIARISPTYSDHDGVRLRVGPG